MDTLNVYLRRGAMDLLTTALRTTHHHILVKIKNLSKAVYRVDGMVLKVLLVVLVTLFIRDVYTFVMQYK